MAKAPATTTVWRDQGPGVERVLFCADSGSDESPRIAEIWHEFTHAPTMVGSVHRARISRIFAAQNRMVVTLADGTPVNCRIAKGTAPAPVGAPVVITITAPPRDGKPHQAMLGARLVSCWFVLLPAQTGVQQSRALTPAPTDETVSAIAACLADAPFACGVIMRRGTAGIDTAILTAHLAAMIAEWHADVSPDAIAPSTTSQPLACIFDGGTVTARITRHMGAVSIATTGPDGTLDAALFDDAYDTAMAAAAAPTVALPSGGTIWIEPTHALCAIDLDSGAGSLAALAEEAPAVLAWQWRLRGLGGLMAVDVPRMAPAAAQKFSAALAMACASDPRHPEILGRTRGGILECRIPHGALPMHDLLATPDFALMMDVLAVLRTIQRRPMLAAPRIAVSPAMAALLHGPLASALASLDRGVELVVLSDQQHPAVME